MQVSSGVMFLCLCLGSSSVVAGLGKPPIFGKFQTRGQKEASFQKKLSPQKVKAMIRASAKKRGYIPKSVLLSIGGVRIPQEVYYQSGDKIVLEGPRYERAWRGRVFFRLFFWRRGKRLRGSLFVSAYIRWFGQPWVSKRDILFGEKVFPSDFEQKKMEVVKFYDSISWTKEDLKRNLQGRQAIQKIRRGEVLLKRFLKRKPDVSFGQKVRVVFIGKAGLQVSTMGTSMGSGVVGDFLKVRILKTGKVVSGLLKQKGLLESKL